MIKRKALSQISLFTHWALRRSPAALPCLACTPHHPAFTPCSIHAPAPPRSAFTPLRRPGLCITQASLHAPSPGLRAPLPGLHTFAHCTPPTVVVLMHWLFFASSGPNLLVLCSNQCLFWILTRSIEEETRINTSHCSRYFKYSTFCGEFCNTPGYKSHNYLP
jgi:hypothetical protein